MFKWEWILEKITLKQHFCIKVRILKPNISKVTYVELLNFSRLSEKYLLWVSWRVLCYQCSPSPLRGTAFGAGHSTSNCNCYPSKVSRKEKLTWPTWTTHQQWPFTHSTDLVSSIHSTVPLQEPSRATGSIEHIYYSTMYTFWTKTTLWGKIQ